MISTRRIAAAVGLAAGIAGLAAPAANAADFDHSLVGKLGAMSTLDSLPGTGIPAPQKDRIPRLSQQLDSVKHLKELNQLNQLEQVLAPVAPVLGLLGGIH
ncbi:hypothetical protein NX794_15500 [Streptomyces sp. LP11]|uniref:Secreted protein n=1 Tax=Streptomyces pyxinicus TaxID=2970331 RepID=A0ABT2B262_9ACTN|nr:hypothetical protein [Streptomyces sp. LP11]MCS0602604.1 hypothetical protein [Streptomyces sp. LP11]